MVYKPDTRTTVQAAKLSVYATNSTADSPGNRADGLLGIALRAEESFHAHVLIP
jgi:hypothetical protein